MKRLLPLLLLAVSATAGATALDTDPFGKMIPFTVSGYAGTSTLEHFPVPVRLSEAAIDGFDYDDVGTTAAAAGANLRFTDDDGNVLDYEIDTWDAAGESLVWVSVPAISGTTTRFRAYYQADSGATLPAVDPTAVWSSAGYIGVWHMNAVEPDGLSVADASGNGLTATARAAAAAPTLYTDGKSPFGNYVKGGSGGLFLPANALVPYYAAADSITNHYSAEIWIDRNASWANSILMSTGEGWDTGAQIGLQGYLYGNKHHNAQNNKIPGDAGVWSFVAATWSMSPGGAFLFCGTASLNDGAGMFLHENLTRTDQNSDFTQFSLNSYANRSGNGNEAFAGYMDEFRLRRVASSKDWAQAVYDSGKAGSTFVSASPVVPLDVGVVGSDGYATGVSCTAATIAGVYAASDPTAHSAAWTLSAGGTTVRSGNAGALGANGTVAVALDDLVPDTSYAFVFSVDLGGGNTVYSEGSFRTAALPAPTVSGVGDATAAAALAATLSGASYAAGTVTAVFEPVGAGQTVSVPASFADGAWTATATTLEADQDYAVRFFVAPSGAASFFSPASAPFTTTGTARVPKESFRWGMDIVATGYDGASTLEHFPVLVRVPSNVAETVSSTAGIRFALADGTLLAHEIEYWNPEGLSAIWVSVPALSGTDTAFRMLWDPAPGASVHGAFSPVRVWTAAGYVGVWHFNAQNADGTYPDATGLGATAVPVNSATTPNAPTTATLSTNGTPWHLANVGLKVAKENTADWTFASTGYTTEAWLIPSADYNRMFLYENGNNTGNALALGKTQIYVMAGNYDYTTWTTGPLTATETWNKTWRFLSTVWRNGDGDWFTRVYENGASKYVWSGNPNKKAVDFTANGMGLTSGTGGNGSMNYSVDEIRVRRGNSTDDWVQANYDTQVLGSDFLTCGEPERMQKATLILIY